MLQKLLEEPLVCEAFEKTGQKGYKVTWKAHIFDLCGVPNGIGWDLQATAHGLRNSV